MSEENLDNDEPMGDEADEESEAALASEAEGEALEGGAGKRTLGIERWVQMGFMVVALLKETLEQLFLVQARDRFGFLDPRGQR